MSTKVGSGATLLLRLDRLAFGRGLAEFHIIPGGGFDLFVPLPGVSAVAWDRSGRRLQGAFLAGPHRRLTRCRLSSDGPVARLYLQGAEVAHLTGMDLGQLRERLVAVAELPGRIGREVLYWANALGRGLLPERERGEEAGRDVIGIPWLVEEGASSGRVAKLARERGLSVRQLERQCRASAGMGPADLLALARLKTARAAVIDGQEPLADLAVRLGFADQAHFSNTYRAWAGISPAADRRRGRQDVVFLQDRHGQTAIPKGMMERLTG